MFATSERGNGFVEVVNSTFFMGLNRLLPRSNRNASSTRLERVKSLTLCVGVSVSFSFLVNHYYKGFVSNFELFLLPLRFSKSSQPSLVILACNLAARLRRQRMRVPFLKLDTSTLKSSSSL